MTPPDERPSVRLYRLVNGYQVSQAIHVAATLGVADLLRDGPRTAADLAATVSVDARALYRLLRALAAVEVFHEDDQGRFSLTAMGDCLRADAAEPVGEWAAYIGRPYVWEAWGHLLYSVQSGRPAFPHLHDGHNVWDWRAGQADENAIFDRAMHGQSRRSTDALLTAYHFGQFATVADLGGGHGTFLAALLARYPYVRGLLFDQPHVVAGAAPVIEAAGVADRCAVVAGSFFDAVPPGCEAYILKNILMSFDDEARRALLRRVRAVCTTDTWLLVLEAVVGPPNEDPHGKFSDLTMLVVTDGAHHTREEWAALFAAGGFRLASITASALGLCVLEGVPG
jgi:hypothetical protein